MRIFRDFDRFTVYRIKQLLDDHDIPNFMKNEFASGAIGEVSPFDAQPEVWLVDDEWAGKAQALIDSFLSEQKQAAEQSEWQCAACGEVNEASFAICWQCQTANT